MTYGRNNWNVWKCLLHSLGHLPVVRRWLGRKAEPKRKSLTDSFRKWILVYVVFHYHYRD